MSVRYLALDCETGGIGPEVSLLTIYLAVLNEKFDLVWELDLAIKPEKDIYHVTAEALAINKIDLTKHRDIAISASEAGRQIREMIIRYSDEGKTKLVPVGHNVAFDLEKMYQVLLNKKEAEKYISYRKLDTGSIGAFLKVTGHIPTNVSGSLTSYVEHFDIPLKVAHDAKNDTLMTIEVLKAMIGEVI